jgi:hypothetical protein
MLDLRLEVRQSAAVFSNQNGSWALLKKHISGLPPYGILDGGRNFPRTAQGMSASGTKRTFQSHSAMSALRGKADIMRTCFDVR